MLSNNQKLCSGIREIKTAITIDLHESDNPYDIDFAAEWLHQKFIKATFFVPSIMFCKSKYRVSLLNVRKLGHEIGSHGHLHNYDEVIGLVYGALTELAFLEKSKMIYEDFYGHPPKSFRSPSWCKINHNAIDILCNLGYCVDSSSTPGRLSVFTSFPYHPSWAFAPRSIRILKQGLLEIPTSTLIVPAGSPTFLTFRHNISVFMIRLLMLEARWFKDRVLVLQFHSEDFCPNACDRIRPVVSWNDFWLSKIGGFRFKYFFRETKSVNIARTSQSIISYLSQHSFLSLSELFKQIYPFIRTSVNFNK